MHVINVLVRCTVLACLSTFNILRETTKSDLSDETRSPVSPTQVVE
jgi:hypothetical protein